MAESKKSTNMPASTPKVVRRKVVKAKAKPAPKPAPKPKLRELPEALRGDTLSPNMFVRKATYYLNQGNISAADRKYLEQRLKKGS